MSRRSRARGVGVNAFFLFLAYVVPRGCLLAAVAVAARVLGTASFGVYGTAASVAVILSIMATLGMQPLLIREFARAPARVPALMRAAHVVKSVGNLAMLGVVLLTAAALHLSATATIAVALLAVGYAIGAYTDNLSAYVQANERMHLWAETAAVLGLVTGVAGIALVAVFRNVTAFCVAAVLGQLGALAWLLTRVPPEARWGGAVGWRDVWALARSSVPFAVAFFALTLYTKVDVVLLARWRGAADVGLYVAAYKALDIVQALAVVGVGAAYPRLARVTAHVATGDRTSARVLELAWGCALPVATGVLLLRATAVRLLFGPAYAEAVPILAVLAVVIPMLAVDVAAGYVLAVRGGMRWMASTYAVGAALDIALNALWIPTRGPLGAAFAVLCSEVVVSGALLAGVWRSAGVTLGRRAALLGVSVAVIAALAERARPLLGEGGAFAGGTVVLGLLYVIAWSHQRTGLAGHAGVDRVIAPSRGET